MRISDWSSDVCSSDLLPAVAPTGPVNDSEQKFYTLSLTNDGSLVTSRTACRLARQPFRANRRPTNFLMEGAQTGDLHALHCSAGVIWDHCTSSRSEEHTSELQSLMRISYAVFCLEKKKQHT